MQDVPEYVLAPIVRAYRDQKRFAEAERWVRDGTERFPLDATFAKLLGLVLADQGRTNEALRCFDRGRRCKTNNQKGPVPEGRRKFA